MNDRNINDVDLCGTMCPYPVVELVKAVDTMRSGEKRIFYVDDPLAIKSVPEELEEYDDVSVDIIKEKRFWKIVVKKEE